MTQRLICFILSLCLLTGMALPAFAMDPKDPNSVDLGWVNSGFSHLWTATGYIGTPFAPRDGFIAQQNPPTFLWPEVKDAAGYDLVICTDRELKDIKYEVKDIKTNFYNFPETMETGTDLFWAVKFKKGGKTSGWSDARRFRIRPDAYPFTVPDTDALVSRIPKNHPRVMVTEDTLEEFRSFGDKYPTSGAIRERFIRQANTACKEDLNHIKEPGSGEGAENAHMSIREQAVSSKEGYGYLLTVGYAYLLTGDEKYARRAIDIMMRVSDWDIYGTTAYTSQDQVHREIALYFAMAYDWVGHLMTDAEKEKILKHTLERARIIYEDATVNRPIHAYPYESHTWTAYGFLGIISIALYGDVPEMEEWFRRITPTYIAIHPSWSFEDGGWSQGTAYWRYSSSTNHDFMDVLYHAGIINMYDKIWSQNEHLWVLYALPFGTKGTFGDQSNVNKLDSTSSWMFDAISNSAYYSPGDNSVRNWLASSYPYDVDIDTYIAGAVMDMEKKAPHTYPLSHEFNDIGWVVMTDDLVDEEKIHMTFKSSHWGSFSHSHPDQNAFILQAFGENIACKSGYYDYYHSTHDSGFTRRTGAHNTITVATNKGQKDDDMSAKGEITAFLNHSDFDLASGDATRAYYNTLDYFERHIVYIRPDIFVIIDDLDSFNDKKSKFEWWLNTEEAIEVYEDGTGVRVVDGAATLDTTVQYPKKVTTYYNNIHALSDMVEIQPELESFRNRPVQKRVWFETEGLDKTKMIVTMDVHRTGTEARYTDTEYAENYVKMTFEDGTVLVVNTTSDEVTPIKAGNFEFSGAAIAYNDESVMLVSGTSLKKSGTELISSPQNVSVVMGKNELGLSSMTDYTVTINTDNDYIDGIETITDYDGNVIGPQWGITVTEDKENSLVTMDCKMDNYTLMLNGKKITVDDTLKTDITIKLDGEVIHEGELSGYTLRDGTKRYSGNITIPYEKYNIASYTGDCHISGYLAGDSAYLGDITVKTTGEAGNVIELKSIESYDREPLATNGEEDADTLKDKITVMVEAEDGTIPAGAKAYTTRPWLSNGQGVQLFNTPGTYAYYTFDVKEAGIYDIAVKYVAFDTVPTVRAFELNGVVYRFTLPQTLDYGTEPHIWKYIIGDTGAYLEPGRYTLAIEPVAGQWNYDYVGLVKREQ